MAKATKVRDIGEYELYFLSKAIRPGFNYILAQVQDNSLGRRQIKLWLSDHTGRKIADLHTQFEHSVTKLLNKLGYETNLHRR